MNDGFKIGDFDVADKEHGKPPKKYEDVELQALLDEDDSQTQKQLAEQLSVCQQAVSNRLREMGKIQKVGRWEPHELNERQIERRKNISEILLERYRRKSFLHRIVTGDKSGFFLESQAQKIMSRPRRTIHIDRKTESLWQEDDALCLVGPEGCGLL